MKKPSIPARRLGAGVEAGPVRLLLGGEDLPASFVVRQISQQSSTRKYRAFPKTQCYGSDFAFSASGVASSISTVPSLVPQASHRPSGLNATFAFPVPTGSR